VSYFEVESPIAPFVIEGLFREGQLVLVAGNFAVGKTPVLADWGVCISKSLMWCGRQCHGHSVVHMDFESHPGRFKSNYKNICHRLQVSVPKVPQELEAYVEHDTDAHAQELLQVINKDFKERVQFLRAILGRKPNAVIILDPVELLFPVDTTKKRPVLQLYSALRVLLKDFPKAAILMVFNLRKRNKMVTLEDNLLLTNPHDWMQEVCGSLDLVNRADTRIGVDRYVGADDTLIISGVGRSEAIEPIIAQIEALDDDTQAGFGAYHLTEADLLKLLTPDMRKNWKKLPAHWCPQDALDVGMSKSNVSKLKKRALSLGILEIDPADRQYFYKANGFGGNGIPANSDLDDVVVV
jgi:hypothetical protein